MTNKNNFPEVGQKYQNRFYDLVIEISSISEQSDGESIVYYKKLRFERDSYIKLSLFWENFKEIPQEPKAEDQNEFQKGFEAGVDYMKNKGDFRTDEVKEALEELKYLVDPAIDHIGKDIIRSGRGLMEATENAMERLTQTTQNLINALESNHISKEELAISKKETTTSIWKPIGESPDHNCQVLIKAETGNISRGEFWFFQKKFVLTDQDKREVSFPIKEYCTLTEFVNEALKK